MRYDVRVILPALVIPDPQAQLDRCGQVCAMRSAIRLRLARWTLAGAGALAVGLLLAVQTPAHIAHSAAAPSLLSHSSARPGLLTARQGDTTPLPPAVTAVIQTSQTSGSPFVGSPHTTVAARATLELPLIILIAATLWHVLARIQTPPAPGRTFGVVVAVPCPPG